MIPELSSTFSVVGSVTFYDTVFLCEKKKRFIFGRGQGIGGDVIIPSGSPRGLLGVLQIHRGRSFKLFQVAIRKQETHAGLSLRGNRLARMGCQTHVDRSDAVGVTAMQ